MNKMTSNVLALAIAVVLAGGLAACNRNAEANQAADVPAGTAPAVEAAPAQPEAKFAKVLAVDPVRKTITTPRQVCHDETVTHTEAPKDEHRIAGTAIGAVVGGVLGNQVGKGKGRKLATVAGAVGGGVAGNKIQEHQQQGKTTTSVERVCETVNDSSTKVVGYDVRYEYNGVTRTVRMDHDPGDKLQVEDDVKVVGSR